MVVEALSNLILRRRLKRAESEIDRETIRTLDSINIRYSLEGLSPTQPIITDDERLSNLIKIIEEDKELVELDKKYGAVFNYALHQGERTSFGGFGVNLFYSMGRLVIYDWNDYSGEYKELPANIQTIKKYRPDFNSQILINAIVSATERDNFIKWYADFRLDKD